MSIYQILLYVLIVMACSCSIHSRSIPESEATLILNTLSSKSISEKAVSIMAIESPWSDQDTVYESNGVSFHLNTDGQVSTQY